MEKSGYDTGNPKYYIEFPKHYVGVSKHYVENLMYDVRNAEWHTGFSIYDTENPVYAYLFRNVVLRANDVA